MFQVSIDTDSINTSNNRITTFLLRYPRYIHGQVMSHRVFSRNAQSSRAFPTNKMLDQVLTDPVKPMFTGLQSGMVGKQIDDVDWHVTAQVLWQEVCDDVTRGVRKLLDHGVHKQQVNRLLEPFATISVVLTTTEIDNFYSLRIEDDAQPEIQQLANLMLEAANASIPIEMPPGSWHLPLIRSKDYYEIKDQSKLCMVSAARCARVSYLTHLGTRDISKDLDLADDLFKDRHMSPFEHQAMCAPGVTSGNFVGWAQHRKMIDNTHAVSKNHLSTDT